MENSGTWKTASILDTTDVLGDRRKETDSKEEKKIDINKEMDLYLSESSCDTKEKLRKEAVQLAENVVRARCDDIQYLSGYTDKDGIMKRFADEKKANLQLFAEGRTPSGKKVETFSSVLYDPFRDDKMIGGSRNKNKTQKMFCCINEAYAVYSQHETSLTEHSMESTMESNTQNYYALCFDDVCNSALMTRLGRKNETLEKKNSFSIVAQMNSRGRSMYGEFLKAIEKAYNNLQVIDACSNVHQVAEHCRMLEEQLYECLKQEDGGFCEDTYLVALSTLMSLMMLLENFRDTGLYSGIAADCVVSDDKDEEKKQSYLERAHGESFAGWLCKLKGKGKAAFKVDMGSDEEPLRTMHSFFPANKRVKHMKKNELTKLCNLCEIPEFSEEFGDELAINSTELCYQFWEDFKVRTTLVVHKASSYLLVVGERLRVQLNQKLDALPETMYPTYDQMRVDMHTKGFCVPRIVRIYNSNSPHFEKPLKAARLRQGYRNASTGPPKLVSGSPIAIDGNKIAFLRLDSHESGSICVCSLPKMDDVRVVFEGAWDSKSTISHISLAGKFVLWVYRNKRGNMLNWVNMETNEFSYCAMRRIMSLGFSVDKKKAWIGMMDGRVHFLDCEQDMLRYAGFIYIKTPTRVCRVEMTGKRVFVMANGVMNVFDTREGKKTKHNVYNFGDVADFAVRNYRLVVQRSDHLMMYFATNNCSSVSKVDDTVMKCDPKKFREVVSCTVRNMVCMKRATVSCVGEHLLFMRLL